MMPASAMNFLKPIYTNIPGELMQYRQWVNWRAEPRRDDPTKMTKPPYHPNGKKAESNNPLTWCHFLSAKAAADKFSGIGFVLTNDDPIVGLDFDHCRCAAFDSLDPEIAGGFNMVLPQVADHVRRLDSYTELSPSGRGLHVFLKGRLPVDGKRRGDYEAYQSGRYLTVTGHSLDGFPRSIESRQAELDAFYEVVFGAAEAPPRQEKKSRMDAPYDNRKDLLDKAFKSKNGSEIQQLYSGDYSAYPSQSEADLSLCSHLAFWFDGDAEAMDAAFRQSGLYREKWDTKHYGDGRTYGEATIQKALDGCTAFFGNCHSQKTVPGATESSDAWPQPLQLPDELPPVEPFDMALLPSTLKPWAADITERFQCPPDFVGAAIMAALASVVGRKIGIRPQARTDWTTVPNLWALLVGRSGVMKSPAMEAALAPLKRLAAQAGETFQSQQEEYKRKERLLKIQSEEAEKAARTVLKKNPHADVASLLEVEEIEAPALRRYIANDTTVAALGELLRRNQNGFLTYRDEMVSLLKGLDREDAAGDRGFYLTAWNGDSSYTIDRIGRGLNLYIPAVCLSLLGSTQPARIAEYIRHAVKGTSGDDGLIQRFSMLVWPDMGSDWKDIDRWPDHEAKQAANEVFEYLDKLNPLDIGAVQDKGADGEPEGIPYLRFDDAGRELFLEWRTTLETNLRGGDLSPALESHFSKYRKLIPAIALLIHLAEGKTGPVGFLSVLAAVAWGEYLQTHTRRAYASITTPDISTARGILLKLKRGELKRTFSARDIYHKGWSGLSEPERVRDALTFLEDLDWLASSTASPSVQGGRPKVTYTANPRGLL